MSVISFYDNVPPETLTSDNTMETLFLLSNDERERAEGYTNIMNKARQFGISAEVADFYKTAAQLYKVEELWEMPKPLISVSEVSELPLNAFPSVLSDYLKAVSDFVQVYPEMCVLPMLSVLSTCVQGKAVIRNPGGGNLESLNLYTVTVAEPGERKSGVFKAMTEPLFRLQREENKRRKPLITEYRTRKQYLENQIETAVKQRKEQSVIMNLQTELDDLRPVSAVNLNVNDATGEAIINELQQNDEKIAVLSDEGGIFDILSGIYSKGNVNIDLFLKGYDGSHYHCTRVGRGSVDLDHPLVTLGLMTQPQAFEKAVSNPTFIGRGLIHRCMFSFPKSKSGHRSFTTKYIDTQVSQHYEELVERLLSVKRPDTPPILTCDKEATNLLHDYFNSVEVRLKQGGEFCNLKEWANKQLGKTLRIAGIFHLCEHEPSEPINGDTAFKAIQIAMWQEGQAKRAFEGVTEQREKEDAEYILEKVRSKGIMEYSKTELKRLCRKFKRTSDLDEPLELLKDMAYLKEVYNDAVTKGRPTAPIYIFNPFIFK